MAEKTLRLAVTEKVGGGFLPAGGPPLFRAADVPVAIVGSRVYKPDEAKTGPMGHAPEARRGHEREGAVRGIARTVAPAAPAPRRIRPSHRPARTLRPIRHRRRPA